MRWRRLRRKEVNAGEYFPRPRRFALLDFIFALVCFSGFRFMRGKCSFHLIAGLRPGCSPLVFQFIRGDAPPGSPLGLRPQDGSNPTRPTITKRDGYILDLSLVMVGLVGFEPTTSPLSGVRSNLLSYRPIGFVRYHLRLWRARSWRGGGRVPFGRATSS